MNLDADVSTEDRPASRDDLVNVINTKLVSLMTAETETDIRNETTGHCLVVRNDTKCIRREKSLSLADCIGEQKSRRINSTPDLHLGYVSLTVSIVGISRCTFRRLSRVAGVVKLNIS